jgi:hypothetical protein
MMKEVHRCKYKTIGHHCQRRASRGQGGNDIDVKVA